MLLVPLLAVNEFKCQLNAHNFVTVSAFMRGSSTDRGPPMAQVRPPQLSGQFHPAVCDSSSESDSAAQPFPGVLTCQYVCVCAPTPA